MKKKTPNKADTRFCSFCGQSEHDIQKLIAGPTVFICDGCISLCVSIINQYDNKFINTILVDLKRDKQLRRKSMTPMEAPAEFWELLDEANILQAMSEGILQGTEDLTDQLYQRAHTLMKKSKIANNMAWKLIHDLHPETVGKHMNATHGTRQLYLGN